MMKMRATAERALRAMMVMAMPWRYYSVPIGGIDYRLLCWNNNVGWYLLGGKSL